MQRVSLFVCVLLVTACSTLTSTVEVSPALKDVASSTNASIFGLYREGRMDSFYWERLTPQISHALGAELCATGFGEALKERSPALFDRIASESRESGPAAHVVAMLADQATSDLVLVFIAAGRAPRQRTPGKVENFDRSSAANGSRPQRMPGDTAGRGPGGPNRLAPVKFDDAERETTSNIELTMKIYSRTEKTFIGLVRVRTEGWELEPTLDAFTQLITKELPMLKCGGWGEQQGQGSSLPGTTTLVR